ncbi:hypothetical protein [Candidatus Uabimicrobium sp. HlEnr_7]|uniref:hypothetical protein n=1 Tax=Candidatus Uabimicrobium helgolandensis TaxID=3095367 RepID=UPI0035586A15
MPWQKKIFEINDGEKTVRISFFPNIELFKNKLEKHLLSDGEPGWKKVFPEILQKYNKKSQISQQECVDIYEEVAKSAEKDIQFMWKYPLRAEYQRQEKKGTWIDTVAGISPYGFAIFCKNNIVVSMYYVCHSENSGSLQTLFAAIAKMHEKTDNNQNKDAKHRNIKMYTNATWTFPFKNKNQFSSFFDAYEEIESDSELVKKIDDLLAKYQR